MLYLCVTQFPVFAQNPQPMKLWMCNCVGHVMKILRVPWFSIRSFCCLISIKSTLMQTKQFLLKKFDRWSMFNMRYFHVSIKVQLNSKCQSIVNKIFIKNSIGVPAQLLEQLQIVIFSNIAVALLNFYILQQLQLSLFQLCNRKSCRSQSLFSVMH